MSPSGGGSRRLRAPGPGPGARPSQPMGAALEPPPPPREESARGLAGEIVSDVPRRGPGCPGPTGPRGRRGAPGRKPDTQCGRQLRTRRPRARPIPNPSAPASPAPAERGAAGQRRRRLREESRPPRAHSAEGRRGRLGPAEGRRGLRLCSGRGGPAPRARDSPCCWAPWPRCAGGSGSAGCAGGDGQTGGALRFRLLLRFRDSDSDSGRLASCSLASSFPGPAAQDLCASWGYL